MPPGIGTGTIAPKEYTATTAAGKWTQYLNTIVGGMIVQIYVKADHDTSIFTFKVVDGKGREVYSKKNITGFLNELEKYVPLAQACGPYRLLILDADPLIETFGVLVMVQEMR